MRKPGKVVTQSPPSLRLVPLKFGMSSEAEEMSSKPSLQNRCQTREGGLRGRLPDRSNTSGAKLWAVGEEKSRGLGSSPPRHWHAMDPEQVLVPLWAPYSPFTCEAERTPVVSDFLPGLL